MKTTRFSRWACVKCGYEMDAASDPAGEALPVEGDYACCLRCAEPYVLESHTWRPVTDEELMALPLEDKQVLSRVQILIRKFNKENPR